MIKHVFSDIGDVLIIWNGKKLCADLAAVSEKPVDFFLERLVTKGDFSLRTYPEWALKCDNGNFQGESLYDTVNWASRLKVDYAEFKKILCGSLVPNEHGLNWLKKIQESYSSSKGQHVTTAILSNIGDIHWKHLYDTVYVIKNCDDYVLSYQHGCVKPQKEIFKIAFKMACELRKDYFGEDLKREECLFVDDRTSNCEAGKKFGFVSVEYDKSKPKDFDEKIIKLGVIV